MVIGLAILLIAHGLIHLLGAAKAFRWMDLEYAYIELTIDDVQYNVRPR